MQLYLIPPECGQVERAPKRRRWAPSLRLTDPEQRRLRAALRGLRGRLGSRKAVAAAMGGVSPGSLANVACGADRGSPALVLLAARTANTTAERLLGGLAAAIAVRRAAPREVPHDPTPPSEEPRNPSDRRAAAP